MAIWIWVFSKISLSAKIKLSWLKHHSVIITTFDYVRGRLRNGKLLFPPSDRIRQPWHLHLESAMTNGLQIFCTCTSIKNVKHTPCMLSRNNKETKNVCNGSSTKVYFLVLEQPKVHVLGKMSGSFPGNVSGTQVPSISDLCHPQDQGIFSI